MTRINLIPPEILEKRKTEGRLAWVLLAFVVVAAFLVGFFGVMRVSVGVKEQDVASAEQETESLELQAARFQVFEEREEDLQRRVEMSRQVLQGRVDWNRLCQELSLVLPDDVWLTSINGSEELGVTIVGSALDFRDDVPDSGHKIIASTLVRLADLDQLYNVWLSDSTKAGEDTEFEEDMLDFTLTANVLPDDQLTTAEGAPAPPEGIP